MAGSHPKLPTSAPVGRPVGHEHPPRPSRMSHVTRIRFRFDNAIHVQGVDASDAVLLAGDVPLLRVATLAALVGAHEQRKASATVVTAEVDAPDGYSRVPAAPGSSSVSASASDHTVGVPLRP